MRQSEIDMRQRETGPDTSLTKARNTKRGRSTLGLRPSRLRMQNRGQDFKRRNRTGISLSEWNHALFGCLASRR